MTENVVKHTYREVFIEFFAKTTDTYIRKAKAPKTLMEIENINTTFILKQDLPYETFADDYIEDLHPMKVKELKLAILELKENLSHKRLKVIMYYIDKVFVYACDHGYVTKEFIDNITINEIGGNKQKSKSAVRNYLSQNEFDEFLCVYDKEAYTYFKGNESILVSKLHALYRDTAPIACFRSILYKAFYMFVFYAGARKNEARGLVWRDLILPHNEIDIYSIRIDKQYTDKCISFVNQNQAYTRNPKSSSGIRVCYLHENCSNALLELKRYLIVNDLYNKDEYIFKDFYTRNPKPIPETNIDRCFHYILDATDIESNSIILNGISRRITIHGMRHSACSMLLEKGMEKKEIAKFLGHSDYDMVDYVYNHFIAPAHSHNAAELVKFFKD